MYYFTLIRFLILFIKKQNPPPPKKDFTERPPIRATVVLLNVLNVGLFHQSRSDNENRISLLANQIVSFGALSANGVPRRIVPLVGGD